MYLFELSMSDMMLFVHTPSSNLDQEKYWLEAINLLTSKQDVFLDKNNQLDEYSALLNSLAGILQCIENLLKTKTINVAPTFSTLITSLTDLLDLDVVEIEVSFKIIEIVTKLSEENIPIGSLSFVSVVCFLLCHCESPSRKDPVPFAVGCLMKLCSKHLGKDNVRLVCREEEHRLLSSLKTAFSHLSFCTSNAGVEILSSLVVLDSKFIKALHDNILRQLITCKKAHAISFGELYFKIWEKLSESEEEKPFEENYIQWLMDRACTLGQNSAAQRYVTTNVQALLSGIHLSRREVKFSTVVKELYEAILWKYLKSENSVHRYNAAKILIDVYPLDTGKNDDSEDLIRKQHDEMLDLLVDPCPATRVIAIKGICANVRHFWITFQNGTLKKALKKFVSDLVLDGSSCAVRRAVYEGLTNILNCKDSHSLLKNVLPLLKEFIHDENPSVRQAFILMLLKVKTLDGKIKYYDIVSLEHFAARLANDSPKNRLLIVRLIFSSFFNDKLSLKESFVRVCEFIKVNPTASRYLARYSYCELTFKVAVRFTSLIFLKLKSAIENLDENGNETQSNSSSDRSSTEIIDTIDRRRSSRLSRADDTADVPRTSCDSHILAPQISLGLLDFIGMLWLIHEKTLQTEGNKRIWEELHKRSGECLPVILRYFRGTEAYFGAVNVASMIPYSKLSDCTTVAGACKTILAGNLTVESPSNEYHCLIHALCCWNRGNDVIELATEWIDEAFRSQSLNESAMRPAGSRKRVRFSPPPANSMKAVRVLDELFSSATDQKIVFSKNVDELRSLMKIVSKVKILIESRIKKGCEIDDPALSDAFLVDCLTLYGNLIIMFDENAVKDHGFWTTFNDYLDWCSNMLTEFRQIIGTTNKEQIVDTFIFSLLQVPLKQCVNVIALGKCRSAHERMAVFAEFVFLVLDSGYGLHFVEMTMHFFRQMLLYCEAYHKDFHGSEIMSARFPQIVGKLIDILATEVPSKQTFVRFVRSFAAFKNNLIYIYLLSLKLYPNVKNHSCPSYQILHAFCQSLMDIMLFPITECETLNVDTNAENLPFIGRLMVAVFTSKLELASALLYVFKTIIEKFTDRDGLKLLACAALFHIFAFSENKIPRTDLLKVVKVMNRKMHNLPADDDGRVEILMDCERSDDDDRTIIDVEETTESAVKEIGLHILVKITDQLKSSLPGDGQRDGGNNS